MSETLSPVGYCGLDCAGCFSYTKTVSEAAKSLRRELRVARLKDAWNDVPFLGEYEPFKKTLDGLARFRCSKLCREGGGNPWYRIRKCCQKEGIEGCWQCADFETCNKLAARYLKNIRKIKEVGIDGFTGTKGG